MDSDGPPFEVPLWGSDEGTSTNTCTIDGFLTTLLCAKWKDPFFPGKLLGKDKFTSACREFVTGRSDLNDRKHKFIDALYAPTDDGEYDLWGDEAAMILEKAKGLSTIEVITSCGDCHALNKEKRDSFIVRRADDETLREALMMTLAEPAKDYCVEKEKNSNCTKTKHVELRVPAKTWLIPIDLSQGKVHYTHINKLPPIIGIGGVDFKLGGVTLFIDSNGSKKSSGHYSCVMWHEMRWLYYDGMAMNPIETINHLSAIEKLKPGKGITCKIAYYFRCD